jgi:hypothetical protein
MGVAVENAQVQCQDADDENGEAGVKPPVIGKRKQIHAGRVPAAGFFE